MFFDRFSTAPDLPQHHRCPNHSLTYRSLDVRDAYQTLQKEVAQLLAADSGFTNIEISQNDIDGMLNLEIAIANLSYSYSFDIEIQEHQRAKKLFKRETLFGSNDQLWTLEE